MADWTIDLRIPNGPNEMQDRWMGDIGELKMGHTLWAATS